MEYTIKGIISAERACECCGNKRLERNVILADKHGELMYVGSDCAGKLLHGTKKAANTKLVVKEAEFINRCLDLLKSHPAKAVESYVNSRSCNGKLRLDRLSALGLA